MCTFGRPEAFVYCPSTNGLKIVQSGGTIKGNDKIQGRKTEKSMTCALLRSVLHMYGTVLELTNSNFVACSGDSA